MYIHAKRPCKWPLNRANSVCVGAALLAVLKCTCSRAASMRVAAGAADWATAKRCFEWALAVWSQHLHGLYESELKDLNCCAARLVCSCGENACEATFKVVVGLQDSQGSWHCEPSQWASLCCFCRQCCTFDVFYECSC